MNNIIYIISIFLITVLGCSEKKNDFVEIEQPVYVDKPYWQDYAIKYYPNEKGMVFHKVFKDRNDVIQVLTDKGLMRPNNGHFQYPGTLEPDISYQPMADKKTIDMILYQDQFVYLDDQAIFSNAWAGKLYTRHQMNNPKIVAAGADFSFLIASEKNYALIRESSEFFAGDLPTAVIDVRYSAGIFFLLTSTSIYTVSENTNKVDLVFSGESLSSFDLTDHDEIVVGTNQGYLIIDQAGQIVKTLNSKLPWPEITAVKQLNGKLWFGSTKGAFMLKDDGKFNYYHGERWLPGNEIKHIATGPDNSVLILTNNGLSQICFKKMTLEEKALAYEKQVRQRHVRYGINSDQVRLTNHNLSTAQNRIADSDNLWTGMYLASQLFRYLETNSDEAKQNCYEAFEAMERLHEINNIQGLFGRTFERSGYHEFRKEYRTYVENYWYEGYNNNVSWNHADDPEWDWRASASSDQTVGQMFALFLIAEHIDDQEWKQRAVKLLDDLMGHIVKNNYMLVDVNGKPSLWGRWNPEYVNRFQTMVGDRKVYSSNLVAFLQAAYKHTSKEIYKEKAFELMRDHGYLENLTRPFSQIGRAPETADAWSKMLSSGWNHSDDEMYFLAYWALYPYAFNDSLRNAYRDAIKDHWEFERPEKNALWNFTYAMTGAQDFDLDESIWHLKEFPLDMIQYETTNSHRKDIELIEPGFWGQTTSEVLPPDERPQLKHNKNLFDLDAGDRQSELSAGDTYLLPYWMGRYLGVISAPVVD